MLTISTIVETLASEMPKPRFALTEAEWIIIKAVWTAEPCTAPQIQEALTTETGWTYSTVRTLMDRMTAKKLLKADKTRGVTIYQSAINRLQAQRSELLYALKHAFNGALSPMIQCLLETEELSPEEIAEIESLIRTRKKGSRKT